MTTRIETPQAPGLAAQAGASPPGRGRQRHAAKGRQPDAQALAEVDAVLAEAARAHATAATTPLARTHLIEHLHRLQDAFGHLSARHLAALAQRMRLAQAEVYEVATFYHHFDVVPDGGTPPAALTVRVCDGLPCRMAGSAALHRELTHALAGAPGDAPAPAIAPADAPADTPSPRVRVVAAPCVGRCDAAPAAVVHRHPVAPATAAAVCDAVAAGRTAPEPLAPIGLAAYRAGGGYALWQRCRAGALTPDDVIAQLDDAGLRGLGGAGFPAGRKWRTVRAQPAPRYAVVNIDEGEPGTFKDRYFLERDPHRFIEGLLVACWAVGIDAAWIYLRDEYHACREMLQAELAALRASDLGPSLPALELRRGAGAYICGEESAMIESIEGKRGWPRLRPPYVAQAGLFGQPTLAHNLETLHWVREIVERGAAWFAGHGRHGRQGLRSFSVSGRVREPGVKLAPAGITLRELIDEHCGGMADGHALYAYLPGGASGGILPAALADAPLDFDTLQPHGAFIGSAAVIVLSQHDRAADAARNVMRFFEHESCGQCTPCRNGTAGMSRLIAGDAWDAALLGDLSAVMRDASICGLGQAAPNAVDHVLQWFGHELQSPPPAAPAGATDTGRQR